MTDLFKLHETFFEWISGISRRRSGKTTLFCHEIAAGIQLEKKEYIICLIKDQKDLDHIWPILSNVFCEQGINILSWNRDAGIINAFYNGKKYKILFFTEANKHNLNFYNGFVVEFD